MKQKLNRIGLISILLLFVSGCASYSAATLEPVEVVSKSQSTQMDAVGGTVTTIVFQDEDDIKKYYSRDLLKQNMLPVHFKIENIREQEVLEINPVGFRLVAGDDVEYKSMTVDQAINQAKFSHGQSVAWTVGFGIIGGAISASKVNAANTKLSDDYLAKSLKTTLLQPSSEVEGTVFFLIKSEMRSLDGTSLRLPLKNTANESEVVVIPLSGEIKVTIPEPEVSNDGNEIL